MQSHKLLVSDFSKWLFVGIRRHLASKMPIGSPFTYKGPVLPAPQPDVLRLYSMRFCPYAQRTRLALAHKGIEHEVVNVDLYNKPGWFFERNPLGLVPILERNSEVIFESELCNDWLEDQYPQDKLYSDDQYIRFQHKMLQRVFEKKIERPLNQLYYKPTDKRDYYVEKMKEGLRWLEQILGDKLYISGQTVGIVDYHIWPWIERMEGMYEEEFPILEAWMQRMKQLPAVKETMFSMEKHRKFLQLKDDRKINGGIDYDFDLHQESKL